MRNIIQSIADRPALVVTTAIIGAVAWGLTRLFVFLDGLVNGSPLL